jgi:glutamine amidotransferase
VKSIAVIDYGMGNLRSVTKALEHVAGDRYRIFLTSSSDEVSAADKVVVPGQGAARDCMLAIDEHDLRQTVREAARSKPFLGICMGMQVLVHASEESAGTDLLGIYPGEVRYFGDVLTSSDGQRLKVPHMGWNQVEQTRPHPLWRGIDNNSRFYFVHSYYLETEAPELEVGRCEYGRHFTCAIASENVFAMQCHPEKSADAGLKLLSNFIEWDGQS